MNRGGLGENIGVTETGKSDCVILEFTKEKNAGTGHFWSYISDWLESQLQKFSGRISMCQQPETQRKNDF